MERYLRELDYLLSEPITSVRERERFAFDQALNECGGRLVLFGAGNLGRKALTSLRKAGVEPLAFTDNSSAKWGRQIDGVGVLAPEDAAKRYRTSALFVVTIWSQGHSYVEIKANLERQGCTHVVSSSYLRWKFANELLPDYCQDLPRNVYEQACDVRAAASLWEDEYSCLEYLNQVRWRALGNQGSIGPPVSEESYFLDAMYEICPDEVFVDCGAYDGDTIRQFIRRNRGFKQILAIEADPSNYRKLKAWTETIGSDIARKIKVLNVAIASTPGRMSFDASGTEGARLSSNGSCMVDCMRIDDLSVEQKPTFIKMDIEGAEIDALKGANRALMARPLLSICVYHRQSDLWQVPLLIHSLAPDYKFFLRSHEADGWQLVCYAIPQYRLKSWIPQ